MQRVIIINLNGNAYQIDEPGYTALVAYLDRAVAQLKGNPDQTEILADLEQAIAEKCRRLLGPNKTVVTAAEVQQILQEMGPVDGDPAEQRAESAASGAAGAAADDTASAAGAPKRLYRSRDGARIGGVCQGLANYLNADVVIIRVIFVVLGFLSGLGALVYIILMCVIPYADTPEEQASARGVRFNAQELIDQATKNYAKFRANRTHRRWRRRQWRRGWPSGPWDPTWGPRVDAFGGRVADAVMVPMFGFMRVVTTILLPLFRLVNIAAVVVLVLALISLFTTGDIFGWIIPWQIPRWLAAIFLVLIYQSLAAPLIYARHVSRDVYGRHGGGVVIASSNLVWLGFVAFSCWWGYHHVPEVHDFMQRLAHFWHDVTHDT